MSLRGSQEPRIRIEPERTGTDGTDAAELYAAYASPLDPWQADVLNCWLGYDAAGNYTATSAGLALPRQNGKNVDLEAREFYGMAILKEKILHTAHQVKTAKASFRRMVRIFTDPRFPEIKSLVKHIRYTNGEETIELDNGGSIQYMARSRQAARGFDGISVVVFDEAQELTDDQVAALLPTLSASATGSRQTIYTGTPPYPNCPGTVFRRMRESVRTDPSSREAWHEWSVEAKSVDEIKLDDHTLWAMCNPALGIWLDEDATEDELRRMTSDDFARERLGWWTPVAEKTLEYAIPEPLWDACRSDALKPEGKTAYGIKFTFDSSEMVLCGAVIPPSGKARVSIIERRTTGHGTQWLADWLNARYSRACCVVIDGRNGADVLIDKIAPVWKTKGSVVRPSGRDICAAASTLLDALNEQTVTWYSGQPDLRDSAITAVRRPISGGWGFGGDNSAPVEAAALALWGAKTSKRNPDQKMRIG